MKTAGRCAICRGGVTIPGGGGGVWSEGTLRLRFILVELVLHPSCMKMIDVGLRLKLARKGAIGSRPRNMGTLQTRYRVEDATIPALLRWCLLVKNRTSFIGSLPTLSWGIIHKSVEYLTWLPALVLE